MLRYIEIDGKRYAWKDIVRLRREQIEAERRVQQPTLFEFRDDSRPASQRTVRGRYEEPTLFKVNRTHAPPPRNAPITLSMPIDGASRDY